MVERKVDKDDLTDEDNNVKYFLKTPELKDKLIKKEEPSDSDVEESKDKKEVLDLEKEREQKLILDKEKLAQEYEEKLKTKLQEALEKQKQTLEVQLKKQFEHRERELNQKIEDAQAAFELREQKSKELHDKKENYFSLTQKDLQNKLKSQEQLELSKSALKKSKREIELKLSELLDGERNFQILKDKKENNLESKRKELDLRFDYFRDKEREEFEKEKVKITQDIQDHVSCEFHDKLEAAEGKLRVKFANNSSEKIKNLRMLMDDERRVLKVREQKLIEESNQKQISLDQIGSELDKKNKALARVSELSESEISGLKNEISNLSTTLKEKEDNFMSVKNSLKTREQKLIEESNQKQISLDQIRLELDKKNMILARTSELSKEQVEKLNGEISNLSITLKQKEEEFVKERSSLKVREQKLINNYNEKQTLLDKLQDELESKILIFEMAEKLGANEIEKLRSEIKNKNLALEEKQKEIEIEVIKKQKDLEVNGKNLALRFETFKNVENEKFNVRMIEARKKIFEDAHKTLGMKFSNDLRMKEQNLKRQMEERLRMLKKDLKAQSDIEVAQGINEKIEFLEGNLRNQIVQLESKKV